MKRREGNLAVAEVSSQSSNRDISIHPAAVLAKNVSLGRGVQIHANVVIADGVVIEDGVRIFSGCYIGEDCMIGENTIIYQNCVIRERTQIGKRAVLEAGVVIGSDGFGYAKDTNGDRCKIPQIGYVVIGDDVRIGSNTTVDRATLGKTVIHNGAVIGSLVQVAHNVTIGERTVIQSHVGICGSNRIGSDVFVGHGVGMVGHLVVGAGAHLAPCAGITKEVPEGALVYGYPGCGYEEYRQRRNSFHSLPDLWKRVEALEKRIETDSK
ncbi:MAG TPA: UDP-3-O-(3-hydroxymyristoyl)glucosamine N-acyltransferase [bacterium]|nr:UDP-3-O-(3-hydroxymyristoyl)glucosamine N-acyltransferase [bacterium]HQL61680.1 UDP-3-O-(3-hydroxymyristoyl)glucosamine N-acyltransferase [bacterium]